MQIKVVVVVVVVVVVLRSEALSYRYLKCNSLSLCYPFVQVVNQITEVFIAQMRIVSLRYHERFHLISRFC